MIVQSGQNSGDALAIVGNGSRHPRHQATVAVIIGDIVAARHEVPAAGIVHMAIVIVVEPVARDLSGVDPQVGGQVDVGQVDARVDQGDHDGGASLRLRPGWFDIDLGQSPLCAVQRIIHHGGRAGIGRVCGDGIIGLLGDIVRLGIQHGRVGGQGFDCCQHVCCRIQFQAINGR